MSVDKVEQLFQKALEMTRQATSDLGLEGAPASQLLQVTFTALLDAERDGGAK